MDLKKVKRAKLLETLQSLRAIAGLSQTFTPNRALHPDVEKFEKTPVEDFLELLLANPAEFPHVVKMIERELLKR